MRGASSGSFSSSGVFLSRALAAVAALTSFAAAAGPELIQLYPIAGQQGSKVAVTAFGKFDPWPPRVWVDAPGLTFTPGEKPGNFEVEIAGDAKPGPRLVRFVNESGTSAPRFFIVSDRPETGEAEPNDEFKAPQKVASLPAVLSGRLNKADDVDSFAVDLKQGQSVVARVEAYVLASAFDGMLRIVDSTGAQFAFNHDAQTIDPFLGWEAPRDGTFIVQVMGFAYPADAAINFTGGDGCGYRLHLNAGPVVRLTRPMGVARGQKSRVQLEGWNLPASEVEVDATQIAPEQISVPIPLEGAAPHLISVSDYPEALEDESSPAAAETQLLLVPGAVTGRIGMAREEDRYSFQAVKQREYRVQVIASTVGSSLDAWIRVEDQGGKELARSDDVGGSRDPELFWTAPDEGRFRVAVGDVTHQGGPGFAYRLAITEAAPGVSANSEAHSLKLEQGNTGELKVAVKLLNGFKAKLQVSAKQLPEGIAAPEVDVPEKGGDVVLKFTAAPEAPPASVPFQLVLRETETGKERSIRHSLTTSSEDNGVPQGYSTLVIDSADQLWLTVTKPSAK